MSEITKRIENMHEGQILFISDFSDLNGNEKVVSRALSAEEKKGNIVRLAKGMYLRPQSIWNSVPFGRRNGKSNSPS